MKKILIIGGAGYIGRVLLNKFSKSNYKVYCFDNYIYKQEKNPKVLKTFILSKVI